MRENENWKQIDLSDLYIRKNSILDLSDLTERRPCGSYGRVIMTPDGHCGFENAPDKRIRFVGFSFTPDADTIGRTKEEITAFADALAQQGYNLVRFHGITNLLMSRWNYDGVLYDDPETIPFLTENEDIFHYFLFCLKERGIYVYLDLMTFFGGWTTASIWGGGPDAYGYHLIAGEKAYRDNYRAGVLRMLNAYNPYTKMRLADDPVFAVMLFHNEQNLRWSPEMPNVMHARWVDFLKAKYQTCDALRLAWQDADSQAALPEVLTWDNIPMMSQEKTQQPSAMALDMAYFIREAERETTDFFEGVLKEAGYRGLTSQWDFIYRLGEVPVRALEPVVSMHAYHGHPSDYINKGSFVPQCGAFEYGCSYLRVMAPVRMLDRPFMATEYGQVFWNRFRHEQGLAGGAYGALQDWDALVVHAVPAAKSWSKLTPFHTGGDVPIRASEVVAMFAFLRRDVSVAKHTIGFTVSDEMIFQGNRPFSAFNGTLAYLFAVSKVGLRYPEQECNAVPSDWDMPGKGDATFNDFGAYGGVSESSVGRTELKAAIQRMREQKMLSSDNVTAVDSGVYESDTGEILMSMQHGGSLRVMTPRLEGVTLKNGDAPLKLDALTVSTASVPAAVTAIARNSGETLRDAKRILCVIATDSVNSNMSFSDSTRQRLEEIGDAPVLVECGIFALAIENHALTNPVAYAIKLNGERAEQLPVRRENGMLYFDVNTAQLPEAGPTAFFEITDASDTMTK